MSDKQDATLIESHKRTARYCYKHFRAYQPLNTWWPEQGLVLHSEFRDGNVDAGFDQKRVFEEALACLPEGVETVYLRSDTAGYLLDLLRYCAEGKNERFGVIEFAIGADVTVEFKKAVAKVPANAWHPLPRRAGDQDAEQQWAEVVYVPDWIRSKNGPMYRFLAIREPLRQLDLPGLESQPELPFPTMEFAGVGRYKLVGLVTNRTLPGDELIRWSRQRCGKSEEAHAAMKGDLAGGHLPSWNFGANAAWWQMMILALNLTAILKRHVLGGAWADRRLNGPHASASSASPAGSSNTRERWRSGSAPAIPRSAGSCGPEGGSRVWYPVRRPDGAADDEQPGGVAAGTTPAAHRCARKPRPGAARARAGTAPVTRAPP